jgi:hypothetical protein
LSTWIPLTPVQASLRATDFTGFLAALKCCRSLAKVEKGHQQALLDPVYADLILRKHFLSKSRELFVPPSRPREEMLRGIPMSLPYFHEKSRRDQPELSSVFKAPFADKQLPRENRTALMVFSFGRNKYYGLEMAEPDDETSAA